VPGGTRWIRAPEPITFRSRMLAALFPGKCLAALTRAVRRGEIATDLATDQASAALSRTPWGVYVKRPFGGAARLSHYLGRYTHRVGLSNHRLVAVTADAATFGTKDGRTATCIPRVSAPAAPPRLADRLRENSPRRPLASCQVPTALPLAQRLPAPRPVRIAAGPNWPALLHRLTGTDLTVRPRCQQPTRARHLVPRRAEGGPP
jgi:hypothetical protein